MKHLLQHFKTLTKHPQNAEELKGLILQLAVQGKLTENWRQENPNVEPASNLLERIKEEKKVLIAEKKIKKDKALPPIEVHEKPYDLPKSWIWCRLGEVSQIGSSKRIYKSDYVDEGIPFYRSKEIGDFSRGEKAKSRLFISESKYKELSQKFGAPAKGDLLITSVGSIGNTWISDGRAFYYKDGNITQISKSNFVNNEFVQLFVKSPTFINEVLGKVSGTAYSALTIVKLKKLTFMLPPLEEQRAIVAMVNELFAEVEQLEEATKTRIQLKKDFVTSALQRLSQVENVHQEWQFLQPHFTEFFTEKSTIKQLRDTILQLAVQGKLTQTWRAQNPELVSGPHHTSELLKRIQTEKQQLIAQKKIKKEKSLPPIEDHEKPYDLPEGWVWCRMGDISEKLGAGSTPTGGKSAYVEEGIKFFRSQNIYNDYLKLEQVAFITDVIHEKMKCTKVKPKDILLNITGGSIGRCALIPDAFDTANVSQHVAIVRMIELEMRGYIHQFILSPGFQDRIMDVQVGVSREGLSMTKLKMFPTPLPPLKEQKAIVKQVNTLMALCDSLEEHIENSQTQIEQLLQSCLREVFEVQ
ncbi:restriction endonuclease subunit S [Muricauda ruestringensis]|uniref:restriction endonuclease subunit S n=1 Tax=Flagellimonas ruestringensis TaxID=111501 RepID=UPI001CD3D34A|nr:restriction endonuclease subunit S [Allomuricauda ruestringensis]MCA0960207.1 restriction endonuclease subunit S [Allomuricauda ruestringensis]